MSHNNFPYFGPLEHKCIDFIHQRRVLLLTSETLIIQAKCVQSHDYSPGSTWSKRSAHFMSLLQRQYISWNSSFLLAASIFMQRAFKETGCEDYICRRIYSIFIESSYGRCTTSPWRMADYQFFNFLI